MQKLLILSVLFAVGCGGGHTPVVVTPPPPPPCYQINGVGPCVEIVATATIQPPCYTDGLARFPQLKVYTDSRGRQFCYDDTEAQVDPSLLPLRWDRAGEQIQALRPAVDLNDPVPLNVTVFKFMPHDEIGYHDIPYWHLSRVPGMPANQDGLQMVGDTTVDTWPLVEYVLAEAYTSSDYGEIPQLSVVRHESLHLRWFGFFPNEYCPDGVSRVFEWTEHGGPCDPFAKPTTEVVQ